MPDKAGQILRVDAIWLATEPMDMRAGPDTALARVVQVFGEARAHHAYLFANKRGNREDPAARWPGAMATGPSFKRRPLQVDPPGL